MMHESEGYKDRKIKRLEEEVELLTRKANRAYERSRWFERMITPANSLRCTCERCTGQPSIELYLEDN